MANKMGIGYSGGGAEKNNPQAENEIGAVIPKGIDRIEGPIDDSRSGPEAFRLIPDPGNNMFGRAGFEIHGQGATSPALSSQGSIVVEKRVRDLLAASDDRTLHVIDK